MTKTTKRHNPTGSNPAIKRAIVADLQPGPQRTPGRLEMRLPPENPRPIREAPAAFGFNKPGQSVATRLAGQVRFVSVVGGELESGGERYQVGTRLEVLGKNGGTWRLRHRESGRVLEKVSSFVVREDK